MGDRGTARYHWNFPICPIRVTIDLSVLRAFEHDLEKPGDEQGLLYGRESTGATHVNGREPLASFGREEISAALDHSRRTVVGYYRIREGRAFILTTDEIDIAQDLFRLPSSVMLLMERRGGRAAEGTFFFWRGESFVHNLPMPFPIDAARLSMSDMVSAGPRRPLLSRRHVVALQRAAAIAGGAIGGVAIAAVLMRAPIRNPIPARPAAVSVAMDAPASRTGAVQFIWDPNSMPAATAGLLEVEDGGEKRDIPLDADQLRAGSFDYTPASGSVHVELSTLQRDGRVMDASVSMRSGSGAPVPITPRPAPAAPVRLDPAPPPPARDRAEAQAPPAAEPPPARDRAETQPPPAAEPAPARAPVSAADRRVELKPFTLVASERPADAVPVVLEPPPVEHTPLAMRPALPIAPVLGTHAPPPPPALAPRPTPTTAPVRVHAAISAGRLIWTGTLQRRGVVELVGRSVSVGSISGALPGVPISISISPAEFEGDGLVVYTTDAARHNHVEPASAATGWNKVTWVWDPSRVHEIAVLEPPNPSNGFSRLAFRSDARRTSMVWIDWRVR